MITTLNTDHWQAASHLNMIDHLAGPLAAGAVQGIIAISAEGKMEIASESRGPLVLVAPIRALGPEEYTLKAVLDQAETKTNLPELHFDPYTEAGAFLPLYYSPAGRTIGDKLVISLQLFITDAGGNEREIDGAEMAGYLQANLVEGIFGRLIYMIGAEKLRLRRQAREIMTMRRLDLARDNALDRIGADLGVVRFAENLAYEPAQGSGQDGNVVTQTRREPDDEYRRRIALYRGIMIPTRDRLLLALNGPGNDPEPNRGPISQLGFSHRFSINEKDNCFAVAIQLVATSSPDRARFLSYVQKTYLVHPHAPGIHNDRYLPSSRKNEMERLRNSLLEAYLFPAEVAVAPHLAAALDRIHRCRKALGINEKLTVKSQQAGAFPCRYELGLGVDIKPLTTTQLQTLYDRVSANDRLPASDLEAEALLQSMTPRPIEEDPEGRWFFEACGLKTLHRVNSQRLYLSHLPTSGLVIEGDSVVSPNGKLSLEARYHAPGDPGGNIVIVEGLREAARAWQAWGGSAWTGLSDSAARQLWRQAAHPIPQAAAQILNAVPLPVPEEPTELVERLERLPDELLETLQLDQGMTTRILNGDPSVIDDLRRLIHILQGSNLASVLPLIVSSGSDNKVLLIVSVIGLPDVGTNLSQRRSTGFKWYAVPLSRTSPPRMDQLGARIGSVGSRTVFETHEDGLYAVVVLGYARRGDTDPYEYRIELPDQARLNLLQYEFLMNILELVRPIGVEVNTYSIRHNHVDLDEDDRAEPLHPVASRTFRPFQRKRFLGEISQTLDDEQ